MIGRSREDELFEALGDALEALENAARYLDTDQQRHAGLPRDIQRLKVALGLVASVDDE